MKRACPANLEAHRDERDTAVLGDQEGEAVVERHLLRAGQ